MNPHCSDDLVERFSMGSLQEPELGKLEEHLLRCQECQESVRRMDFLLDALRNAAGHLREEAAVGSPVLRTFKAEYVVIQAAVPERNVENLGIALLDADSDRLYCRFRRDLEKLAEQGMPFERVPDVVALQVKELGAQKCLEWMESSFSALALVRVSPRASVVIEDYPTAVHQLYGRHIRANVLRFRTHLPQYSLEAAAGKFGKQMSVEPEGWVEVAANIPLTDDMFVTHVKGHSMEPQIPDPSLCVFKAHISGSWEGKVLLIEQYGELGGNRYTVKLCQKSMNVDPNHPGDEAWLHHRVTLESLNRDYDSWDIASAGKIRALGEFLFVV